MDQSEFRRPYYPTRTMEGKLRDGELPGISGTGMRKDEDPPEYVVLIERTLAEMSEDFPRYAHAIRLWWYWRANRTMMSKALCTNKTDVYRILDNAESMFMGMVRAQVKILASCQ